MHVTFRLFFIMYVFNQLFLFGIVACVWDSYGGFIVSLVFLPKKKNHIFGVLFAVFLQQDKFEYLFKEGIFKAIYCESHKN